MLALATIATGLVGCTSDAGKDAGAAAPPDPRVVAIRGAVDEMNSAANGPVAAQREVFERLAAPTEADAQRECPEATMTLGFEPAWAGLRRDTVATERETSANGAAYLLPTFLSMYRGGRIVGSDMVTLHVWIAEGRARTPALCVA